MTQEQLYPDGWYKIWYGDKHFNVVTCREALEFWQTMIVSSNEVNGFDTEGGRNTLAAIDAALADIDSAQPAPTVTIPDEVMAVLRELVANYDGPIVDTVRKWLDATQEHP